MEIGALFIGKSECVCEYEEEGEKKRETACAKSNKALFLSYEIQMRGQRKMSPFH